MCKKLLFLMIACGVSVTIINAQKSFWQVNANTMDLLAGKPGIKINLGNGNELKVYASSSERLQPALSIENILGDFFKELNPLKDSINSSLSYTIRYSRTEDGKGALLLQKIPQSNMLLGTNNGKAYQTKVPGDSIYIYLFGDNFKDFKACLLFKVNNCETLKYFDKKSLSDSLLSVYNRIKDYETAHPRYKAPKRNYYGYYFIEKKSGKGKNKNRIEPYYKGTDFVQPSIAANIQNYKNYFTPSFTLSVDVHAKSLFANKAYATLSLYGQYMFSFEKDAEGKSKTFRNSFIGIGYEYQNADNKSGNVSFYAPFSIAYLARRRGYFFDKHTFNLGIGGIKYGGLTIKPSMYFHDFFKNATPSVQLSVGIGR